MAMSMRVLLVLMLAWTAAVFAAAGAVAQSPGVQGDEPAREQDQAGDEVRIVLPLIEDRLSMRDFLTGVCDAAGMDRPPGVDGMDWSIDPTSGLGRFQLRAVSRWTKGAIAGELIDDAYVLTVQMKQLDLIRAAFDGPVLDWINRFSNGRKKDNGPHGIRLVRANGRDVVMRDAAKMPEHLVLLVHGLDEPGWMWDDLLPFLFESKYAVAKFDYPNDGSIPLSADLFAEELKEARRRGVKRVSIVGKSMGGLVARDVLTRAEHYGGDGSGGDQFPAVTRLIMVGTPNHGSYMARFRYLTEFADHAAKLFTGRIMESLRSSDGHGEAGEELLPGSQFLTELNGRPMPTFTKHTIIAGRHSPIDEAELSRFVDSVRSFGQTGDAPPWLQKWVKMPDVDGVEERLRAAVRGYGDGVVTLDSARIEGVTDFVEVEANHMALIRNFVSDAVPPATPIILDRLDQDRRAGVAEEGQKNP